MTQPGSEAPNLAAANQWRRPSPGKPKVFLSFHSRDSSRAQEVKRELTSADIAVVSYDPAILWPDGPMEMLRNVVTECHCVVYVARWRSPIRSQYVRFELSAARNFEIRTLRVWSSREVSRSIRLIAEEAERTHVPDFFWGHTVSRSISQACRELRAADLSDSAVDRTGITGLDLLGRYFDRQLSEGLGRAFVFTPREKILLALICIGIVLLLTAVVGFGVYAFSGH